MAKVVLLVPFSSEEQSRILIWRHVNSWLGQTLDYPMFVGEHFPDIPARYNLSLARNHASHLAGDWGVAVIHDADTVINPLQIKNGVAVALETGAVVYPYTERWELDFEGTKMLLNGEQAGWESRMTQYNRNQPLGGCIIVRRDLWELVRGFDSGFVGWGHEDGAFAIACEVLSGKKLKRIAGKSLHLEHKFAPAKQLKNPIYLANKTRIDKYIRVNNIERSEGRKSIYEFRNQSLETDAQQGIIWPKHQPKKEGMDKAIALILLKDITSVLDKYGCTHWLSDGTMLGAIRENNFIAHDDDVDLGVWAEDFDIRAVHELMKVYNCTVLRLQGKPDDGMIITVGRAGIHLDMFFYYPAKKAGSTAKKNNSLPIYCSFFKLIKPYNTSNKAKHYDYQLPNFKPLIRRKFLGYYFWVPKNAEKHLATAYGQDWRTPKTNWDSIEYQSNVTLRGTVNDMASERQLVEKYLKIYSKSEIRQSILKQTSLEIGLDCEYLFTIPWFKKGGSELLTLNYINAIKAIDSRAKITVLAVAPSDSPWKHKLPKGVKFCALPAVFYDHLSEKEQTELLAELVVKVTPKTIHVINIPIMFRATARYVKEIRANTNIYYSVFLFNVPPEGPGGSHFDDLTHQRLLYVNQVFTDNKHIINKLSDIFGYDKSKFSVHYQPNSKPADKMPKLATNINNGKNLKVLWAGRLDNQKRVDILLAVAKEAEQRKLPVEFHVYGSSVTDGSIGAQEFKSYSNVVYEGPFDDGIWTLPCDKFNVFLLTSQIEGLPNAVIQAMGEGLPVIAPDVGGVGEVVNKKTGFLIPQFDDINAYVDVLAQLVENPQILKGKKKEALDIVARQHSWAGFVKAVKKQKGYIKD